MGVRNGGTHHTRCGQVIRDSLSRDELRRILKRFPHTKDLYENAVWEAAEQHLQDKEDVLSERALEHDGHVRRVE